MILKTQNLRKTITTEIALCKSQKPLLNQKAYLKKKKLRTSTSNKSMLRLCLQLVDWCVWCSNKFIVIDINLREWMPTVICSVVFKQMKILWQITNVIIISLRAHKVKKTFLNVHWDCLWLKNWWRYQAIHELFDLALA